MVFWDYMTLVHEAYTTQSGEVLLLFGTTDIFVSDA